MPDSVRTEILDRLAVVTVSRPEALNALNREVLEGLAEAWERLSGDANVKAVVLTGDGDKAFVAGADIGQIRALGSAHEAERFARFGQGVLQRIQESRLITIVAINGYALGGGLELAMAGDIRLMATEAQVGQPEILLGIIPGFGGTQRLARLAGEGQALRLVLTGERVGAEEALRLGIVDQIYPRALLMGEARNLAATIASRPAVALSLAKRAIREGLAAPLAIGLQMEASLFGLAAASEDAREGTAAFLGKRPPSFTDR